MSYRKVVEELFEKGQTRGKTLEEAFVDGTWVYRVAKASGIELSDEQLKYILCNADKVICRASAGTGKTTCAQLKSLYLEYRCKIPRYKILNIVYNEQNQSDIRNKHKRFCENAHLDFNERITVRTFHASALEWVQEFKDFLGYSKIFTMSQNECYSVLKSAVIRAGIKNVTQEFLKNFLLFKNYVIESEIEYELWETVPSYANLNLSKEKIKEIITYYNRYNKFKDQVDFTDLLVLFNRLFDECPEFVDKFKLRYDAIIVDEYQDFSNLMDDIFFKMNVKYRVVIGDENLAIYEFRGANPYKNFEERYHGVGLELTENRRCPSKIIDVSNSILDLNSTQVGVRGKSLREGGTVTTISTTSLLDEARKVVDLVKGFSEKDLEDSVICFRNRDQSLAISYALLMNGVTFNIKKAIYPLSDVLGYSLVNIFRLLNFPNNYAFQANALYRLLPGLKKDVIQKIILKNKNNNVYCNFWELDFPQSLLDRKAFTSALEELKEIYFKLRNSCLVTEVFEDICRLFYKAYWSFMRDQFDRNVEKSIFRIFNKPITLGETCENIDRWNIKMNSMTNEGITLTTFHGLKGLEYTNVVAIGLREEIIPNIARIEKNNFEEEFNKCNRLMYVLTTRAKENLFIYFDSKDPSYYVNIYRGITRNKNNYKETNLENLISNNLKYKNLSLLDKNTNNIMKEERKSEIDLDINLLSNVFNEEDKKDDTDINIELLENFFEEV